MTEDIDARIAWLRAEIEKGSRAQTRVTPSIDYPTAEDPENWNAVAAWDRRIAGWEQELAALLQQQEGESR